jgi:hypothetical protein
MTNMDDVQQKWAELIKSGSASTFFESFPRDDELAERLNNMFGGVNPVTSEQLSRDRLRYHKLPIRGDVLNEEEVSPTKFVIRNKAKQLDVLQALAEIIDNIFDNYQRNTPAKLDVEIIIYPKTNISPGELRIIENSGGIEKSRIIPLIQLGLSERSAKGIGAWGEGFKMAAFALAEEIEVYSTFPGEIPIAIHFPKGWLDPNHPLWTKWRVNTYKINQNPPSVGTTIMRFNYLHQEVLSSLSLGDQIEEPKIKETCEKYAKYFGEVYAEKYHSLTSTGFGQISITITINSISSRVVFKDNVKDRLTQNLAFIPWLMPIHIYGRMEAQVDDPSELSKTRTASLNLDVYAGISATFNYSNLYSTQDPGVEMWGNGRLFSLKQRISDESVGWGYKFGGSVGTNPSSNASSRRLTIVAMFTAEDSRDIPWAAPVKNDYNRRSEFYAEIQQLFARIVRLYKDALRLIESRILPYSREWSSYDNQKKLEVLFADSDATQDFTTEFAETRFGQKLLSYEPNLSFKNIELPADPSEITPNKVFGIPNLLIQQIVDASAESKNDAQQVVSLLKAIFSNLSQEADLEEDMGLNPEEILEL